MGSNKIAIFEGRKIRRIWNDKEGKWYFSIIDVIAALTESSIPKRYWSDLKRKLKEEGSQVYEKIVQLKFMAPDGKKYAGDASDTEAMFRIIQSIPSSNAEPFKLWLARVGYERVEEASDPELAINRAMHLYMKKGYAPEWINMRLRSIETRKALTDEWNERGVRKSNEYAILTDDITFAWAGFTTKQYKEFKELKKDSLRDNMTNLELVLNMLAEASTTEISKSKKPDTFDKNRRIAKHGGNVAKVARRKIEQRTGKSVITKQNYLNKPQNRKQIEK